MTTTQPQLTLYSYFRSSASARVRTLMELHGIKYDVKFIHLLKGEQKSAEYMAMNAAGTVPLLVVKEADGSEWALSQCIAILEYLDEVFGEQSGNGPLLPRGSDPKAAKDRALIRSIIDILVGDIFPLLTLGTLQRLKKRGTDEQKWAKDCVHDMLPALEGVLSKTSGGKYCYGDNVSMADVCFAPQMYTCLRFDPQCFESFPACKAVFEHVSKLPAFVKADWKHQPDTPDELRA